MKTLLETFEKFNAKYQSRREYFQKTLEKFNRKSTQKIRTRGLSLLDHADALIHELKHNFSKTAEGQSDDAALKAKVYDFKKTIKELHELTKPAWRQWAEAVVISLGLALVLRNFVFGLYHVPTGSAEPNILVGDRIWGNKMAYFFSKVKRGDLVIFDNPTFDYDRSSGFHYLWQRYIGFPIPLLGLGTGPDNWVKRVIAVPGDTIEGRIEHGKTVIYLNGKKLKEPYVNHYPLITLRRTAGFIPFEHIGPFAIPKFLQQVTKEWPYTYDPSKPYSQQPFYSFEEKDVIKNPTTGNPLLREAFTPETDRNTRMCVDLFGPYIIPPGKYWVMGDSRKNSVDSRWWLFLDESLIHGRASFVIYSIDSEEPFWFFDLIKHPIDFWTKHVRWSLFFKKLHGYNIPNNE